MLQKIAQEIKETITNFSEADEIVFNNKKININSENFQKVEKRGEQKKIAFIDGGQAELLSAGNFCLSFIRVFAQTFQNNKKIESKKNEFYLFTRAKNINNELFYESKIYSLQEKLVDEEILTISSENQAIKEGIERAPINKTTNIARRFAELKMAKEIQADFIVLDGTLTPSYPKEEQILTELPENVCALAKSSSLLTTSGNSPTILLNKLSTTDCWSYFIDEKDYFVKLHQKAKHIFRFSGNKEILPSLAENSKDSLLLGYPYGLIYVDKFARVSNNEKNSLIMKLLLKKENKVIVDYLNTSNVHEILDKIEY